ncbi:F0F1-type ATP synthase membrane subunit b/b' [Variovorax boronicumulans]|uniref:serine kinase n=1 Tax=Variovorax boronicumulans TaxID=436515 RepID=UPI00277F10FB|nr:serine kinase [Variovorax boronicumulans]MDQ0071511.1 F0F1-type ATP synthase membrane subunit b/b' [Variovorax boronicumulans]
MSGIDWKLLVGVRERQKTVAMGIVARDRAAADQSRTELQQAEGWAQQQVLNKALHWQSTAGALSQGQCSVAQLRHAGAWSGALDTQIAEAAQLASQAGQAHAQREQTLDASRRKLRAASGDVEKAQQMAHRARAEELRLQEQRLDETSEETASQAWAARRPA